MKFGKINIDLKNNEIVAEKLDVSLITSSIIGVYDKENKRFIKISRDYENKIIENKTLNKISILVDLSPIGFCKARCILREKLIELNRDDLIDMIDSFSFIKEVQNMMELTDES